MFSFAPKLPVDEKTRVWIDEGFVRLAAILGRDRMLQAKVILPDDRYFPDAFTPSQDGAIAMAKRIAGYMGVLPDSFVVGVFTGSTITVDKTIPLSPGQSFGAGGVYFYEQQDDKHVIAVNKERLREPEVLAAILAHELTHVVLLGGDLLDPETKDMELLTDLCTVFLGFGVLNSNAAVQFKQWSDGQYYGSNASTGGYLLQEMWGYALARFARERGEGVTPPWKNALSTDVKSYFARSAKWLAKQA